MADGYQLLDVLPANATEMQLPNYRINCKELFVWKKWQGISWLKFYYITAMICTSLFFFFEIIWAFVSGNPGYIIASLIFMPLFCILCIAGFRILAEVLLTILIMPHQLHQMNHNINNLRLSIPAQPPQFEQLQQMPASSANVPVQIQ